MPRGRLKKFTGMTRRAASRSRGAPLDQARHRGAGRRLHGGMLAISQCPARTSDFLSRKMNNGARAGTRLPQAPRPPLDVRFSQSMGGPDARRSELRRPLGVSIDYARGRHARRPGCERDRSLSDFLTAQRPCTRGCAAYWSLCLPAHKGGDSGLLPRTASARRVPDVNDCPPRHDRRTRRRCRFFLQSPPRESDHRMTPTSQRQKNHSNSMIYKRQRFLAQKLLKHR